MRMLSLAGLPFTRSKGSGNRVYNVCSIPPIHGEPYLLCMLMGRGCCYHWHECFCYLHTSRTRRLLKADNHEWRVQIVFISPEALIGGMEWRSMLATDHYVEHFIALVIDEAQNGKHDTIQYY